jgi:hypothetical protein
MYCLFLQLLTVFSGKHPWWLESSVYIIQALCKDFMEFIILVERMKCWYNSPLQVLTNAPALHSLIIHWREDVADILEFMFRNRGYLRKLILNFCSLGENSTCLLANIVALYPDLERLSLKFCHPLISDGYCFIPRRFKHSEMNLSSSKVDYMYMVDPKVSRLTL